MQTGNAHGLLFAIPTLFRPTTIEWSLALNALTPPMNYNQHMGIIGNMPVARARNEFAKSVVDKGHKFLFFLGDDTEPPAHTLRHLIYRMEHDSSIGVIGGIYCNKANPPYPLVFRGNGQGSYWNWKIGELFEVTGIGMDCTLIRREVFEQLEPPWFRTIHEDGYIDGKNKVEEWTEDLYFCKRVCEETDYKIMADAMVICRHWDPFTHTPYDLPEDSYPLQPVDKREEGQKLKIVDLGCGETHVQFPEGKAIRVDGREEVNPDYRCDLRQLPFGDGEFDIVFSSHTLEHFGRSEVDGVLDEWLRILKPGGELRLVIPNIAWAAAQIRKNIVDYDVLNVLYGEQTYDLNYHKMAFTPHTIREMLEKRKMTIENEDLDGYNIVVTARAANIS